MIGRLLIALLCVVLLTGCSNPLGGDSKDADKDTRKAKSTKTDLAASSELVINGKVVSASGTEAEAPEPTLSADSPKPKATVAPATRAAGYVAEEIVPDLYDDGTLYDGDDPFADERAMAMPVPIERNPDTTRDVDAFARSLRGVDADAWAQWLQDRSPTARASGPADVVGAMMRVYTERCGGAKTVASGVVLGNELVVTTVNAIESPQRRVRVSPLGSQGERLPAIIKYLDVDDDIAVLYVPGLRATPIGRHVPRGTNPLRGLAFGTGTGGTQGEMQRVPVYVGMVEQIESVNQADGFAKRITDRSVFPLAGSIDTGMSGGAVVATNDPDLASGWGFHGLIRSRVPYRASGGGLAVPARLVAEAIDASEDLPQWHELRPRGCPQWYRPHRGATTIR